jgi:hypothetical protein
MKNETCYAAVAIAFLVSFSPHVAALRAPKATQTPCEMTFADTGTNVTSDGLGTYRDGFFGVTCSVGDGSTANSNDIKMTLAAKKPRTRYMLGYFTNPVPPYVALASPATSSYVTIQQIATMLPNSTIATNAHYVFNSQPWTLNWCGGITEGGCAGDLGSMAVSASRSADGQHWMIITSGNSPVGDEADLYSTSTGTQVGLYHMPFQVTIDCLTTCQ